MNLYNDIGRGPPGSHVLDRFATTYATSYQPYDESRIFIPGRCVPSLPAASDTPFGPNKLHVPKYQSVHSSHNKSTALDTTPSNQQRPSLPRFVTPTNSAQENSLALDNGGQSQYRLHLPGQSPLNSCYGNGRAYNHQKSIKQAQATSQASTSDSSHTGNGSTVKTALSPCSSLVVYQGCPDEPTDASTASKYRTSSSANGRDRAVDTQVVASAPAQSNDRTRLTITSSSPPNPSFGMFNQIARINDHLYLSSLNAITPDRLRLHGITLLVSAMTDVPPVHIRSAVSSCIHVNVEDIESACLRVHFDFVADRIAAERRRGGRTLVHCIAGVSRSSSLILAYLMRHMHMSLADAYQLVRSIRPCIQPNPGFWRQLLEYEERIRGSRSVRVLPPISYPSSSNNSTSYSTAIQGNRSFPTLGRVGTESVSRPRRDVSFRSHIQPRSTTAVEFL